MQDKLDALADRLLVDIEGMPWADRKLPPSTLKDSVNYFINAFANDAKAIIQETSDGEEKLD